ncbi:MAG: GspE/PulE family protein [Candidatus Margulisiibacteriota bacterium]
MQKKNVSDVPEIDLSTYTIDQAAVDLVPALVSQKYGLIPLFKVGSALTVAMAQPNNILALDELRTITGLDVSVVRSDLKQIEEAIAEYYGISGVVEEVVKEYKTTVGEAKPKKTQEETAPIVKLVNVILNSAVSQGASDIHIEPEAKHVRVRLRIDGVLHEETTMPSYMIGPIASRVKVLSGMDIAESRIPQDGRFEFSSMGRNIDLRVSSFPSAYGEKIVLRILDKSAMVYKLPQIGFTDDNLEKFRKTIQKPHGIILVTGPTGSGKTTTLYSMLTELNSRELNIMTVEDPIEYEMDGITQAQVNVKAGLTFASALRSILRQDPDVILIGEIRDLETAEIAIQSSLTGHLVFSTLHTNDAAGALTRLLDMGLEPFLISSSVEAILAQRLVRLICKKCKKELPAPETLAERFPEIKKIYKGEGCKVCRNTGYKGRTGVFELLLVDEEIRKMITDKKSAQDIKKYAVSKGMRTLYEDGMIKVAQGLTSLDEVMRVTELEQV